MTLRWRLALLACAVSGVMIVAMFLALFLAVRGTLVGVLNDSLRNGVEFRVGEETRRAGNPRRGDHDIPLSLQNRPNRPTPRGLAMVATFGAGGQLLYGDAPPIHAPLRAGLARVAGYRVLTARSPATGHWVQAYRAEDEMLSSLAGVTHIFTLVAPLVLLLGLGGGYLLADRALRPVDAVTRLAARIAASGQYAERVPLFKGRDEMARLTLTINAMLDKLGHLIEQERAFALAAAHELRTPLAVIRARASLTLERERDGVTYRAALGEVRDVSADLTRLTERLLALARAGGPARLEHFDLADVALEVTEGQAAPARERGARVELDVNSAAVSGDRTALLLAASNLVQNALRYGKAGGTVRVGTSSQGGLARLVVEDDGPGIAEEDAARLVRPFQRGAKLQGSEGAGLGLALVNAVAEQHGGALRLSHSPLGGLRAEVSVPAQPIPA